MKFFSYPAWIIGITLTVGVCADDVIYGDDHRVEVFEANSLQKKVAASAASMVPKEKIFSDPTRSGLVNLNQFTLRNWLESQMEEKSKSSNNSSVSFCSGERFVDQPNASICSGFLIAPDLLVTAGHCMDSAQMCDDYQWIFDYSVNQQTGKAGLNIDKNNVYGCKKIVSQFLSNDFGLDYAVVQLDRVVKNREPLELAVDDKIQLKTDLFVVGSPSGLPLKVTSGGIVRYNDHPFYFSSNLDTYQGNSGSGVFNASTGKIEGILVRGEEDFVFNKDKLCVESNRCADTECRGEDVTRISAIPEVSLHSVLAQAAVRNDVETIEKILLLNVWIDFNLKDGKTALMKAVEAANENATLALVVRGADVNYQDEKGNSSLHFLAQNSDLTSEDILNILLEARANLEQRNFSGETPLMVASKKLNLNLVKLLVSKGANINTRDEQGENILFSFARMKMHDAIKELIGLGANSSVKNKNGQGVFDVLPI